MLTRVHRHGTGSNDRLSSFLGPCGRNGGFPYSSTAITEPYLDAAITEIQHLREILSSGNIWIGRLSEDTFEEISLCGVEYRARAPSVAIGLQW